MGFAVDSGEAWTPLLIARKLPKSKEGEYGPGFLALAIMLREIVTEHKPDLLAYEAAPHTSNGDGGHFFNNTHTMSQQHGRNAIIEMVAAEFGLPCEDAARTTVLKHFVGHGRPKDAKIAVYNQCHRLGWRPQNDDAADAAALWSHFKTIYHPFFGARVTPLMMSARS